MTKVFIDGSQGTTGLKIFDRLSKREDISLTEISNLVKEISVLDIPVMEAQGALLEV